MPYQLTDTLTPDTALLHQLQADPRYAYAVGDDRPSLLGDLYRALIDGTNWLFSVDVPFADKLWTVVYVVLVVGLVVFLLTSKAFRSLFRRTEKAVLDIDEAERDIHAIDFQQQLALARRNEDYQLACRLTYLQALKQLSDRQLIHWEPYKTPTQYTYELTSRDFRQLTHWFLLVRYGNYEADAQTLGAMAALADAVTKGGAA